MHMIDTSNGRNNIAFVGETPWHKLGFAFSEAPDVDQFIVAAGLSHEVMSVPVAYQPYCDDLKKFEFVTDKRVLFRSDNKCPLGIVGSRYNIVQPRVVVEFFRKLCEVNGWTLEVAGAMAGGKKVWCLARVGDPQTVVGHDDVRPYVLVATSYDGSMATVAQFTTVRVVCWNTLSLALSEMSDELQRIRVPHNKVFDPETVRIDMGIVSDEFSKFIVDARRMANKQITTKGAEYFLKNLLPVTSTVVEGKKVERPIEDTRGFQAIMSLFQGEALGAGLTAANGTGWGLLNAVTQYVDHSRTGDDDKRMNSAWFGQGNVLKSKALSMMLDVVA